MQRPIMSAMNTMTDRLADCKVPDPGVLDAKRGAGAAALALAQTCYETELSVAPELQASMVGKFGCSNGRRPTICIQEYVTDRMLKYAEPTIDEMATALVLVDRAISQNEVVLTWRTCHRLYAAALVLAIKFSRDGAYANSYYAKVAGVLPAEFNALEIAMLQHLGFSVWVGEEERAAYRGSIETLAAFFAGYGKM